MSFIIRSQLFQAQHAPDGSKNCLVVWSPAAADQLDAFLSSGHEMGGEEMSYRVVIQPKIAGGSKEDLMAACDAVGLALGDSDLIEEALTQVAEARGIDIEWDVERQRWRPRETPGQDAPAPGDAKA